MCDEAMTVMIHVSVTVPATQLTVMIHVSVTVPASHLTVMIHASVTVPASHLTVMMHVLVTVPASHRTGKCCCSHGMRSPNRKVKAALLSTYVRMQL